MAARRWDAREGDPETSLKEPLDQWLGTLSPARRRLVELAGAAALVALAAAVLAWALSGVYGGGEEEEAASPSSASESSGEASLYGDGEAGLDDGEDGDVEDEASWAAYVSGLEEEWGFVDAGAAEEVACALYGALLAAGMEEGDLVFVLAGWEEGADGWTGHVLTSLDGAVWEATVAADRSVSVAASSAEEAVAAARGAEEQAEDAEEEQARAALSGSAAEATWATGSYDPRDTTGLVALDDAAALAALLGEEAALAVEALLAQAVEEACGLELDEGLSGIFPDTVGEEDGVLRFVASCWSSASQGVVVECAWDAGAGTLSALWVEG